MGDEATTSATDTPQQTSAGWFLLQPDDAGQRTVLDKPMIAIGRSAECDITLDDAKVSARHCHLMWHGDAYRIVDGGSRNGVRVNGRSVSAARLASGDLLQVGPRQFLLWREGDPLPTYDPTTDAPAADGMSAMVSERLPTIPVTDPDTPMTDEEPATAPDAIAAGPEPGSTTEPESAAAASASETEDELSFADDSADLPPVPDDAPPPATITAPAPLPADKPVISDRVLRSARSTSASPSQSFGNDVSRTLPFAAMVVGLIAFAAALAMWINAPTPAELPEPDGPDLSLLRERVAAVRTGLADLVERRAALEAELAAPSGDTALETLAEHGEVLEGVQRDLPDLEDELAGLMARLDQLELALAEYEEATAGTE